MHLCTLTLPSIDIVVLNHIFKIYKNRKKTFQIKTCELRKYSYAWSILPSLLPTTSPVSFCPEKSFPPHQNFSEIYINMVTRPYLFHILGILDRSKIFSVYLLNLHLGAMTLAYFCFFRYVEMLLFNKYGLRITPFFQGGGRDPNCSLMCGWFWTIMKYSTQNGNNAIVKNILFLTRSHTYYVLYFNQKFQNAIVFAYS